MKSVCVVGAGPAGLAGAKVLLSTKKFKVTIFEKADRVGGIWALDEDYMDGYLHPETPTNLSRFTVCFSDLDWRNVDLTSKIHGEPRRTPMFPKAWQVNRYLETYRQKYIPWNAIRFGHEVVSTLRTCHSGHAAWQITTRNVHTHEHSTLQFDHLLLGTGFFSTPRPLPFSTPKLSIEVIHSSKFRKLSDLYPTPSSTAGKSILIIGGGNSAGEAAAAVAQQLSNAAWCPTGNQDLRSHKILHVTPRPLYALPPYVPADEESTTYRALDLKLYDLSKRPPGPITANAGRVGKAAKDMIHTALQGTIGSNQADLGATALEIPAGDPRDAVYVALSESYPEYVRSGLIEVLGGRVTGLEESDQEGSVTAVIEGSDGSSQKVKDIGAVIYATGYSPAEAIDFLPKDVKEAMHYDSGSLRLPLILQDWQTTTAAVPDLALLGFYEGPYWPMIEMQARLTAHRWSTEYHLDLRPYEETATLLDLRKTMQERGLDVPQYWFGDYAGYLEEMAAHLQLHRNDGAFAEREGCVSPARYLSADVDSKQAAAIMQDLHETWQACNQEGRFVARAVFRALQGEWTFQRTIDSKLSSFPSATVEGQASFHPRQPTPDNSGKSCDFEYLYIESGTLMLANGAAMPAKRRYVYRYSEERDELSVWFVKPDSDLEVDYLFHNLTFASPDEARKQGACIAKADHLCVEDMYWTQYRLPMKGISLHEFETTHTVQGPAKDYVATTAYRRPRTKVGM